jgi:DNA-binding transcriptional MerR regulator
MKDLSIKKLYYSISEVSRITGLEQHVLRYWENEFIELKPSKNRAGNRVYTNKDIKIILQIKTLLKDSRYTIDGAKKILSDEQTEEIPVITEPAEEETAVSIDAVPAKEEEKESAKTEYDLKETLLEVRNLLLAIQEKL